MQQTSDASSLLLKHLEGPRSYQCPPCYILVELVRVTKTRAGIFLTGGATSAGNSDGVVPLGKVLAVGDSAGQHWGDIKPPTSIGEYVLIDLSLGPPPLKLEGDICMINFDMVGVRIHMGKDKSDRTDCIYSVPPEEPAFKMPEAPGQVEEPEEENTPDGELVIEG